MITAVTKRDGSLAAYDREKIRKAILKANSEVYETEQATDTEIDSIIGAVEKQYGEDGICTVEEIQDVVEKELSKIHFELAKHYIVYRHTHTLMRKASYTNETVLSICNRTNVEVAEENSNKDATLCSTQRDLIAGEVSKQLTTELLLPARVVKAHQEGAIHFHDMDYFVQPMFNCCLVNIGDMLDNGTVMNGKEIETPKSFQTACTIMTQIIANIASNQYGGQSLALKHLAKYIRVSRDKLTARFKSYGLTGKQLDEVVEAELGKEVSAGCQTIQYQINTLMTTNGQTPFVTLFMQIEEGSEYEEEEVMLYKEILEQRLLGIKNENGVYVTPPFPKLIYVLDECNCLKGGKYDWLTLIAVKCTAKRMYPDYISAKKMRENYDGQVFSCMGCRSFLSAWRDENGEYKWEGRFNQGVVSLNLPQIALMSQTDDGKPDYDRFWQLMEERTSIAFEALMCRHKALLGTPADVSPLHFQYGAIARLGKGEKIDKLLKDGYSTLSLGYIGIYEMTKLMTGVSHTDPKGTEFALKVMNYLKMKTDMWKMITGLGFGLYGTPAESLCYRFARIDAARFGEVPDVTDKGYYTNSYHVDVREKIGAMDKLAFESQFQTISSGGAISYVEIPNMQKNLDALAAMVAFIYDNIQYAEFNTKSDYCMECGFDGEIVINDDGEWECPNCGNKDHSKMSVVRRTCGYLGSQFWNVGKTKEIKSRVLHVAS